tara:strand:- start:101 stop:376 length:276 start_codon:yes stop_codon:yes gene_type:complete
MSDTIKKAEEHFGDRKFFIIEKEIFLGNPKYSIHKGKMYDLVSATRIILALDTLNEDRERISHYLQEVTDKGLLPLVLTDEVKEEQSEMPF